MNNKLRLIINNNFDKREVFFIKKELRSILNLYAQKVSSGDWKDYGLSINKKEVTFDIYQRSSDKPIYRISKNLNPKRKDEKFYILDRNGLIQKYTNFFKMKKLDIDKEVLSETSNLQLLSTLAMLAPFNKIDKQAIRINKRPLLEDVAFSVICSFNSSVVSLATIRFLLLVVILLG